MCFTFSLQFFIPIQIMLPSIQRRLQSCCGPTLVEQSFRIFMVAVACKNYWFSFSLSTIYSPVLPIIPKLNIVTVAALVPHLNIIISLIGALCATVLALFMPVCCQLVLRYGELEHRPSWILLAKNSFIIAFAIFGLVTGTYESLNSMVEAFRES